MSDEAVEALREVAGDVIQAAVHTDVDPTTYGLALGVLSLVIDHDARVEYEAGVAKELNGIVAEAKAQVQALVLAASASAGITH